MVNRAMMIAMEAHCGQVDKSGMDYFAVHVGDVAKALAPYGPILEAAGWLHDVLEDTDITADYLREHGIPEIVIETVEACTRKGDETYGVFILRASKHRLGRMVKLADNWNNLYRIPMLRLDHPAKADGLERRYLMARTILEEAIRLDQFE
jgi:(p)ppGpp synthase/HD superfamily hydrolase